MSCWQMSMDKDEPSTFGKSGDLAVMQLDVLLKLNE
jgi:hypothetical protein